MGEHRWSGWPGAWCLDCGQEDQGEICISSPMHDDEPCAVHINGDCPEPGSRRCDPYALPPPPSGDIRTKKDE